MCNLEVDFTETQFIDHNSLSEMFSQAKWKKWVMNGGYKVVY